MSDVDFNQQIFQTMNNKIELLTILFMQNWPNTLNIHFRTCSTRKKHEKVSYQITKAERLNTKKQYNNITLDNRSQTPVRLDEKLDYVYKWETTLGDIHIRFHCFFLAVYFT